MSEVMGGIPADRGAGAAGIASGLRQFFRVPPPTERVPEWHVGPAIDMAAYHFSWLWVLLPLMLAGSEYPRDYVLLWVLVLTFGFVHRHYTLGYAYLDPEVFAAHRRRFIWVPVILGLGLLSTPILLKAKIPEAAFAWGGAAWPDDPIRLKIVVTTIVFGAGVWNVWHTLMQKYGILRIYTAKARARTGRAVPGWVDRLFVLGWIPLVVAYLIPRYAAVVLEEFRVARKFLRPIVEGVVGVEAALLPAAFVLAGVGVAVFFAVEWRVSRLRNRPRLSMALGLVCLWGSFLVLDPIKVYLAFAFSHGLEYMVFVWAFQRRRYAERREHPPLIARILERPWIAYPAYTLALAGLYILFQDWEEFDFWKVPNERVATIKIGRWVFYWGVFQSLLHFYYDGFLWKTRRATVRESL